MSIVLCRLNKNYYRLYSKIARIDEKIIEDVLYHKWINKYKLEEAELDYALDDLAEKENNTAHFGIAGGFVFTEKIKV
jgi:hypothetical protein